MIKDILRMTLDGAYTDLGFSKCPYTLEHPNDPTHGDYATNIALLVAQDTKGNPRDIAEKIVEKINEKKLNPSLERIEIAGPGFINFFLSESFFKESIADILKKKDTFGKGELLREKKVAIEYTDPNPFKDFHIGHLLPNVIGESLARIIEFLGADVRRMNYQGDVGLHVAKALWAFQKEKHDISALALGKSYEEGNRLYPEHKEEIQEINKKIYEGKDRELMALYDEGKKRSLASFEKIYERLGTEFDNYFFESESGGVGLSLVKKHTEDVFTKSDGAIVYRGEEKGLHTRVFVTKDGLPTYEAKELGIAKMKHDAWAHDVSIVVTGNEVKDYFRVVLSAMEEVLPEIAQKTQHVSHGMLRLPTGKMSSRSGNVIVVMDLLDQVQQVLSEKFPERVSSFAIREAVAVGAVKYAILKTDIGKDMIFDFDESLSFTGDSGPYVQYTYARVSSLLEKAAGKEGDSTKRKGDAAQGIERLLYQFPEVVEEAYAHLSPHIIARYVYLLSQEFNTYYGNTHILSGDEEEEYRIALARATSQVLANGLHLLGMGAPDKM